MRRLFYEDGKLSYTRVLTAGFFMLFAGVTVFLVLTQYEWGLYTTFAPIAGGAGGAMAIANKGINSRWNTEQGSYRQKEESKCER